MNLQKNKRGSVTVLACLFFMTLVAMTMIYVEASKKMAIKSGILEMGDLYGMSILSEYDLNLWNRYGLFAFYGTPIDVAGKIDYYASESLGSKNYINYGNSTVSLVDYSIVNLKQFKVQIKNAGKYAIAEKTTPEIRDIVSISECTKDVFYDLPSEGIKFSFSAKNIANLLKSCTSASELIKTSTSNYFENKYINTYFKSKSDEKKLGVTFLNNEIEYIICGKQSDTANEKSMKRKIIAVREVLNSLALFKDKKKQAELEAAAQLITPGPEAVATAKLLGTAWALAESLNDYNLLIRNHKVPIIKTAENWAIDLDSVINNKEENCVFTGIDEGEGYEDYLDIFLYTMDQDVKLLRVLDLIQINNKYLYYGEFALKDYNVGLKYSIKVNNESYEFEKNY